MGREGKRKGREREFLDLSGQTHPKPGLGFLPSLRLRPSYFLFSLRLLPRYISGMDVRTSY